MAFAVFLSCAYPRKYSSEIEAACSEFGVDENLVRGVIKTESGYSAGAVSHAGATGLMQLMPSTADWVALRLNEPDLSRDLSEPAANIRLGTAYLAYLLDKFPLADALAAYNAGEGNLMKWRAEGRNDYAYKETRDYVKKVLRAKKIYEKLR